jgi:hypothetical protein
MPFAQCEFLLALELSPQKGYLLIKEKFTNDRDLHATKILHIPHLHFHGMDFVFYIAHSPFLSSAGRIWQKGGSRPQGARY